MTARFNSIGDIWNNTNKTTIQTGRPITSDPKLTQLTELMSAFSKGEINFSTLKARLASLDITVNGVTTRASFTYRGKTYNVQQRTSVYSNTKFSSSTLRDIYKLTDEQINTYFTKKSETEYELNKSSGCKTINGVVAKVAQQYQNDMLLANFLNDKNKTTNRTTELRKTSDNKTINSYNYQDYIDEIQSTLGTDTDAAKKKALDKFITDFTQGNVAFATVSAILKAIGVEYKLLGKGNNVGIQFTYDNKTYQLSCKLKAAIQGTDDKTVKTYSADSLTKTGATQTLINKYFDSATTVDGKAQTYALKATVTYAQFLAEVEKEKAPKTFSYSELKNSYKFTDDIINKYFKKDETANARPQSGSSTSGVTYVLNTEAGCKTIAEVEQKMAEQYQKAMVLVNFLNDKNKKTDVVNDMKKAGDGNTITKDNYQKYVDEIKQTLGNDEDAIVEKALEKLVKDFTEGNISMNMVSTIADAMGIDSSKAKFSKRGNELGYEIEYKGKKYTMFCMADALTSGTDDKSLQTYTLSDLQKTEATEEQINKYFYAATTVDGKTTIYHIKPSYTYAQFEEEVKASQKKNGVETSTNAQGYKVETTYVDGVVTKVVEYKKYGKSVAKETEYFANGQVKQEIKYVSYNNDKESVTEYYENGQVKHNIKYGYEEKKESETEYYENGKTKSEIEYNYDEKVESKKEYDDSGKLTLEYKKLVWNNFVEITYNSDGSKITRNFDRDGNPTGKETHTSADGKERYFSVEYETNGAKTLTENDKSGTKISVQKYDTQGRLISEVKYQSNGWSVASTTTISYKADGSKTVTVKNGNGSPTSIIEYDKTGKAIKTTTYKYKNGYFGLEFVDATTKDAQGRVIYYKDYSTETYYDYDKNTKTIVDNGYETETETVYNMSNNQKIAETKTNNDGSKVVNKYENGKVTSEESYDKNGALQTTTKYVYSSDGNYVKSIYDKNEKLLKYIEFVTKDGKTTETTKTATGATTSEKVTTKDSKGRAKTETKNYDANGKLTSRVVTWYSSNGKDYYVDTYDSRGLMTKRVINNVTYNYTYSNYVDSKNYTQTRKCSKGGTLVSTKENGVITKTVETKTNGDIETIIYDPKTSKKKVSYYKTKSTGAIKTTEYDANGNSKGDYRHRLTGEVTKDLGWATVSMDIKDLYKDITDSINSITAKKAIKSMGGDITYEFLQMAQAGYNGKPSGSDKTYVGYQNAPSNVQAHIKKDLAGTVPEYGYTPEEVKGYHYPTSSAMSKKISTNKNFTNYVNKYIKNLVNGTNLSSTRLDFEQNVDKDLWGSLHGTDVVATKLEGTKLTITIYDLYDFANLQGNSNNDVLNRAGYSAMKDGKLKPYYVLIDVVIDLSKSPYNYTAAQLQAMKV